MSTFATKSRPTNHASGAPLLLQRKCTCGSTSSSMSGHCSECDRRKKLGLQAKLRISQSDDVYERDADRIADQVMAMEGHVRPETAVTARPIVRREAIGEEAGAEAPPVVRDVSSPPGATLDPTTRSFFEPRFGHDLGRVRIHTGAQAAQSATAVGALAYTIGPDIVFGESQYQPASMQGRRLLAHELAHVVQQDAGVGSFVQRQPKAGTKGLAAGKKAAPKATAATAPKLDLTPSKIDPPCACLMVVHNDERNARKTAELMHANCAYNLALLSPDSGDRLIKIPGQKGKIDPNSLFPREIAEKCINDEKSCRDFLTAKAGATDKDEIEQFVQTQFFLTISDCSKGFSLPVVTLHNNDIEDTKNYLKEKNKQGVTDLKLDVNKNKKETGDDQITKLKDLIKKKFGESVETEMMETAGKTNIFRWCASKDLSQCHIGDPDHPDNVTWVTNERDFAALSKKDLNVALQSEAPTSKKSESEGDLSTLFVLLKDILNVRLPKVVETLEKEQKADWEQIDKIFDEMEKLSKFGDQTAGNALDQLIEVLQLLIDILLRRLRILVMPAGTKARIEKLRYINIEAPGKRLSDQSDAERVRNYEAVVEVLKATGLHCCGDDPKKAEQAVKEGLKAK